ncbi:hypothetical protein EUX98_g3884 [Antrodiella citrinella]|uniref:Uncharacterized protein n=1 Tax=Antrodiella citrinella TaxID=2447956 RepID=A0A4S4MVF5_9APHY|nr:hypothetical protein EUX98_g3884 [Antrodiella citrinella]
MRSSPQTIQRTRTGLRPALPLISAPTLAGLMDALFQRGRDDLVFFLWDNMEMLYGISPNIYAFNIMLKVARRSKMHNMSIRNAFVQLGLFRRPSTWSPLDEIADPRARLAASFRMSLEQPPTQTGLWDGYPAHRIALRVVTHHLLCLWPELLEIEGPVYALRETGDRLVSHPFTEFAHAMQTYASTQFHHPSPPRLLALVGPPPKKPTYYNVVPNEKSFHLLIHLLDTNDLASEIPLVLAWMRHLSIVPSQWTIAFALVYWRPVSTDSPLLEAMKGGLGRSPYGRLVGWLTAWLGEKGIPSDRLIGKAMRSVEYFKTSNPIFEDKPEKR